MPTVNPFTCVPTDTVNIDVSSSTQSVKVSPNGLARPVLITNDGTATVWINWGAGSGVTAALATGLPIPAGSAQVLEFDSWGGTTIYVAAIAAGSTGKIYFTPGSDGL